MKVRLITILSLLVAGIVVLIMTISSSTAKTNEYNSYLAKARANAKNDVPYTACVNYKKAIDIKCEDEKIYQEYLAQAKKLGDNIYDTVVKNYSVKFPQSPKAYEELCEYYYNTESYRMVISVANTARELGVANEKVRDRYLECFYMLRNYMSELEEAGSFLGGYAVIKSDGKYGYANSSGSFLLAPLFDKASPFMNSAAAVKQDDKWFIINPAGYTIARPTEDVDYLSFISNGFVVVGKGDKFSYTDAGLKLPKKIEYDYASNFKNNIAAVKKGEKWSLVRSDGSKICDYIYDDVIIDEFETCINSGVIFAKKGDKYYMLNSEGEKITDQGFDNAYPFVSSEPAAVCIKGKWGFVNTAGEIVIKPKYENAKSFSIGLAPIFEEGVWKYVNSSGEVRVQETFADAKPFASNGIAAVKAEDTWGYIQLLGYCN